MTGVIDRPEVVFEAIEHEYRLAGEKLAGVSSVAKIGGADDTWGIASAWGWRLGYEGARTTIREAPPLLQTDVPENYKADPLRRAMQDAKRTPWDTRDKAAERGSWVHDVLEGLGQDGEVLTLDGFPPEVRGHVQSIYRWYVLMRPRFVALEVQVASRTHGFAGRYDVRALVEARRILPCIDPLRQDAQAVRVRELAAEGKDALGVIDLKTSKGIYPTTHFPQLEGYEGGGVEMGFPETDFRAVLNTNPEGTFDVATDFAVSWATYEDFLGLLAAFRAIKRLKGQDPEVIREKARDAVLLEHLPARSRELVELGLPELAGMDAKAVGRALGRLGKRGKCERDGKYVWSRVDADAGD